MLAAVRFAPLLKCMWFLELQIICAVHLAKPFGHYSSPRLRAIRRGTLWLQGEPTGSGGRFPGIVPAFWTPLGQKATQPYSWATGGCLQPLVCTGGTGLEPCPPLRVGHFERYALLKDTKPIVAYILGSQEKYLVAKCTLRDQEMV